MEDITEVECYIKDCKVEVSEDYEHYPYCSQKHHEEYSKTLEANTNKGKLENMRKKYKSAKPGYRKFLEARAKYLG